MSKESLLLVDGDTRSLRVLEVSLRKAGFMVTAALSVQDALDKLVLHAPDLIISETTFPDGDGFELRRRVRATAEWSEIPFIFLTAEAAIENKIRGLELGVDDYLTKPIYIKEIVTRINILLQKRQRVRFEERRDGRTRFAGRVHDMPVVDVIQTIEISRKSGVIQFVGERGRQAAIYFRDGRVIDAEAGALQGEDAVYRLLTWSEGEFEVVFRTVRRREVIAMSSQALLMEGMRRLDEWSRLFEQLPPLTHRFEVDTIELSARLGDVPDDNNRILRLFDGKRTLLEVIDASDVGDLECLQAISRLYFEELLLDLDHDKTPRRETPRPISLGDIEIPTPAEDSTSGPTAFDAAQALDALDALDAGEPSPAPVEAAPGTGTATATATGEAGENIPPPLEPPGESASEQDSQEVDLGEVGPLMGGYRPSSLRLIDEAVAAAQLIEPSLFEPAADALPAPAGYSGNGVSHGTVFEDVEPAQEPALVVDPAPRSEREESGLRMIGSLGRDRAEASGELATLGQPRPRRSETARELVTILPRRITREMPTVTPAQVQELAESLPTPTPTSPVLTPRTVSGQIPRVAAAVESLPSTSPLPAQVRVSLPGSGVRAPSRSRRLLRIVRPSTGTGPGLGALLMIILAVVLAVTAVVLRLRRHARAAQRIESVQDSTMLSLPVTPQAAWAPVREGVAPVDEKPDEKPDEPADEKPDEPKVPAKVREADEVARADAPPKEAAVPAGGVRGMEAATQPVKVADRPPVDKNAEAKALYDKAHDALDEGDFARSFELAEASLKVRRTARTYLLRAQAQQRLDRVEDALASVAAAAELAPSFSAVWELRGRILWAARRYDDARTAFEKFLELEPNSPKAPGVRRLINEPR